MERTTYAIDRGVTDVMKFLAALTVVLHHYSQYVYQNNLPGNAVYGAFDSYGGFIAVGVFFFLSGFGLMESEKRHHLAFVPFMKRRCLRVYLPVLLATVIWMAVNRVMPCGDYFHEISVRGLLIDLLWGLGDSYLWFVKVIILLYGAFAVFAQVRERYGMKRAMLALDVMTVAVSVVTALMIADFAVVSVPMFTLGVWAAGCAEGKRGLELLALHFALWCIVTCGLLAVYNVCVVHAKSLSILLDVMRTYPVVLLLALLLPVVPAGWCSSVPRLVSGTSYDIYLVHGKVFAVLKVLMPVVPLYVFAVVTLVCVLLFYGLRTRLKI